ncbi:MAG: hypothetical protein ACI32N_01450 [Bulleidia sp.]
MKTLRKLFGMIATVIMACALALPLAAESFTITISNAQKDETYHVYRMLEVSVNADRTSYSYTIADGWNAFFADGGAGYPFVTMKDGYVSKKENVDMEAFGKAAAAYAKANASPQAADPITPEQDGPINFTFSAPGYFLITSTNGTLSMVATTPEVSDTVIVEKNTDARLSTMVQENSTGSFENENDMQVGKSVRFNDTITAEKGAVNYVLHCELSEGFTFSGINEIRTVSRALVENTDYILVTTECGDDCDFHIVFTESFLNRLTETTDILVDYEAVLNPSAVCAPAVNTHRVKLTYGAAGETDWCQTDTKMYMFDLIKLESQTMELLDDAKFEIYRTSLGSDRIALVKVGEGLYRIATDEEKQQEGFVSAVIEAGRARIMGFDGQFTCYVEEIQAPDGYNRLLKRKSLSFEKDNILTTMEEGGTWSDINGGVAIKNSRGAILPETGGEGTVLFYLTGGALFLIGGIILIGKTSASE